MSDFVSGMKKLKTPPKGKELAETKNLDLMIEYLVAFYRDFQENKEQLAQKNKEFDELIANLDQSIQATKKDLEEQINNQIGIAEELQQKIKKDLGIIGSTEEKLTNIFIKGKDEIEKSFKQKYAVLLAFEGRILRVEKIIQESTKRDIEKFREELASLKSLNNQYGNLDTRVKDLEAWKNKVIQESSANMNKINERFAGLDKTNKDRFKKIRGRLAKIDALEGQIKKLEEGHTQSLENIRNSLNGKIGEIYETRNREYYEYKTDYTKLNGQIEETKKQLLEELETNKNVIIDEMQKIIEDRISQYATQGKLDEEIEKLQSQLKVISQEHIDINEKIQKISQLENMISAYDQKYNELVAKTNKIDELSNQLQLIQKNNSNLMETISKWKDDITLDLSLNETDQQDLQKQINEVNDRIKNIDITNSEQLKGIRDLINKIDKTGMDLILEIQDKIRNLPQTSQYDALKRELDNYKISQNNLMDNMDNTLDTIGNKQLYHEVEINNIKQILGKYQNPDQIEQEIKKILNSTTVINTVVKENRELKDKIQRLENKIEEYYHRLERKGVDFENLESEVQKQRNILMLLTKGYTKDLFMRSNYTF